MANTTNRYAPHDYADDAELQEYHNPTTGITRKVGDVGKLGTITRIWVSGDQVRADFNGGGGCPVNHNGFDCIG